MGFHLSGMLNPQHEIVGSVRKFASNVIALANAIEARADQTSRAGDAGNFMAGIAAILANFGSPQASISAAGERCGLLDFSAARAITCDRQQCENGGESGAASLSFEPSSRQSAQFRHACVLPSGLRFLNPFDKQNQRDDEQERAGRNPHDESTDLLIFERSEMPSRSSHHVGRIPGSRCKRQQRSQDAGMQNCREDIDQSAAITESGSSIRHWPPKDQCCPEESRMLSRVNPIAAQGLVE